MVSKLLGGLAASALALTPVAASAANKAAALSPARAATPLADSEKAASVGVIPAILAAAIVAGGIYLVVDDDDDDSDSN